MGRGDKKTRKGKRFQGSYGKTRPRKKTKTKPTKPPKTTTKPTKPTKTKAAEE